jgi:uncharacterized repeat protein (TIGR02543 family)
MMKMRKLFFKLSMLLLVLGMSVNAVWAGISLDVPPTDWYYVNFETRVSTPACGSNPGQVKLNYTDNQGNQDNPWIVGPKTANPYNEETQSTEYGHWNDGFNEGSNARENGADRDGYPDYYCIDNDRSKGFMDKRGEGWYAGWDWYNAGHYLNTLTGETEDEYQTAWGASANLNGYAMIHMADMDLDLMSAYAYFEAKVKENDGWYFTGWSYKEGDSDLGGAVDTDTPEDKGKLFKIFPSDLQGWSNKSKVYAYATFKPVMVLNYKVNGLINGTGNSTTVVFDAVGERVSTADFTVSVEEDNFSAVITSCANNKVTVTVTYSGSADGEFRGNVTLASKSGCSQLTAAVYARVGATSEEEASLYNNKVLVENLVKSGDLTTLIGEATATQIVSLNNNYGTLDVNRDVTIFTNGYRITTLNVTNGTVTMAYDKYEGGADAVSVTGGKLILNGGKFGTLNIGSNGEVEQNGATFTGAATNNGVLTTNEGVFSAGLTSSKTLTVNNGTFKGETAVTISGGTATINRGSIEGTTCGLKVTGGTATIKKLAAIKGETNSVLAAGGTVNVECGKFDGLLSAVASFTSGYFKIKADAANVEEGKEWMQLTDGVEYNEGYRFFLGDSETAKTNGVGVCRIGDVSYAKLEDALAYANNNPNTELVIFMTNNYTLPAGYYTLPAKATLVVPMSDTQQKINLTAPRMVSNDVQNADENKYINNIPSEFRRLTFATGVNMDVIGKIEITCTQYASNEAYTSQPVGAYGHLVLEEGSHLTLQSGSEVRAWGFVTGKGEMDARRGSVVREMFQMGDWKGAMTSVLITGMVAGTGLEGAVKGAIGGADSGDFSDKKIFPVSQYFIQNIESPVKYHPGALLSTSAAVSEGVYGMSISMAATDIAVVGVSGEHTAIFLMDIAADAENTWVRKWYDAENDVQVYDINSGAHIGSMELDLGGVSLGGATIPVRLNSAMFDLPITSNFKIHLLTGNMDFEQNTALLPGSEVEVDKESIVSISMSAEDKQAKANGTPGHVYHTGAVYVYDATEWDTYAYGESGQKYTKVVRYTPSAGGQPTQRAEGTRPASAAINVHGTFNTADGFVYTTASGANIFSNNEDAGTFIFNNAGEDAGEREVWQIKGKGTRNSHYTATTFTCAKLKNKDNSYTATEDAFAGFAFLYRDDKWQEPMTQTLAGDKIATYNSNCFAADVSMMTYLDLVCDIDPDDPLHSPMNETVKNTVAKVHAPLRIREYLIADAFAKASGFESGILPHEYEYFRATYYSLVGQYGKEQGEYMMKQGMLNSGNATQKAAAGLVPLIPGFKTQAESYDETYDFGAAVQKLYIKPQEWVEIAGTAHIQLGVDAFDFEDRYDNALATVQNNNYSACDAIVEEYLDYIESQRFNPYIVGVDGNTDLTYSDAAGAGRLFILMDNCQWWEGEKKDNLYHCIHPQNDTYYYWDEDAEMWMEKKFTITWKNWNGDIIQTADADGNPQNSYEVTYGTMAEFLGTNPTRSSNIDYTYDFTGWSPALGKVTSNVTYTASFTEKPRKYTIIFLQEGGVEIERQFLTHNEVPVCENVPTKVGHTLVWSPAIAAVTGDATYTATWEENPPTEYEITFYDYNGTTVLKQGNVNVGDMPVPPAQVNGKPATSEYTYVFDHWSPAVEKVSATSIKSYTAVYRQVAKTFPVNFYFEQQDAEHKIGATQFLEIGQTPVIPDDERLQKTEDNANVYQLVWTPQIQTVVGHAEDYTYNYVASYTSTPKQYSLTLKCTPSGAAVITGTRADYAYEATPTVTVKANTGYNFVRWSDGEPIGVPDEDGVYSRKVTINGNIELTVVCECPDCDKSTIKWMNENGKGDPLATDLVPVGSATIFHGATPEKENSLDGQYSYTFYGWTTAANEGGTKYKNGMTPVVPDVENPSDQTYTYYACFTPVTRQYNVALSSNIPNVCMLVGAGTYDYSASAENATVIVSGYDAVNYTFDGWYNGEEQVSTAESYSFAVKSDVNLVAKFSPVTYTITWKSEDGNSTLETDAEQAYGAATAFNSAEPTKEAHSFIGWTTAVNGEGSFYAKGATPAVYGDATYYAYFAENTRSLEIGADGSQTLDEPTDYTTFTITSNGVNSGQLINANNLSLLGEAIFKLQPAASIPARTWYAVAAPWQVDVRTGIYAGGRHLNVGRDFDIIEFNAESYAVNEAGEGNKNIWRYVEENGGVMQPGKLYMIYLASAQSSLEFHKTGGGISTTTLSLTTTSVGSDDTKANWNAIANPALYHADLNMTVIADASQDVLQYINGGYTPTTVSNMIVGAPVFVQVNNPQSTVNATMHSGALPAPAYRAPQAQTTDNRFVVEIARNGMMNDRLIVQTSEEKDNAYVIGKDLAKMGVGTKTAQMWISRYNTKLSKNTVEMSSDRAEYPLSIYAPAAGEYVLTAAQQRGDVELFLTRNGEAIWNLSEGDYVLSLDKGTTAQYGLRISAKAPQTATGVDEAIVDAQGETRKVLIDNKVFIIRGDKVYSVDGQLVK